LIRAIFVIRQSHRELGAFDARQPTTLSGGVVANNNPENGQATST
jgi:hypothetical protein